MNSIINTLEARLWEEPHSQLDSELQAKLSSELWLELWPELWSELALGLESELNIIINNE